mmetsp:Transcript_75638/g.182807  ORF Transcript_75638/g.182807 Transcript_75638/m.182807 type:complete len:275 (-) Transcript_75638:852-1676(-)
MRRRRSVTASRAGSALWVAWWTRCGRWRRSWRPPSCRCSTGRPCEGSSRPLTSKTCGWRRRSARTRWFTATSPAARTTSARCAGRWRRTTTWSCATPSSTASATRTWTCARRSWGSTASCRSLSPRARVSGCSTPTARWRPPARRRSTAASWHSRSSPPPPSRTCARPTPRARRPCSSTSGGTACCSRRCSTVPRRWVSRRSRSRPTSRGWATASARPRRASRCRPRTRCASASMLSSRRPGRTTSCPACPTATRRCLTLTSRPSPSSTSSRRR